MLRANRTASLLLAPAIPRNVWDPKHHNHKHVDSFAKSIADRRIWPAKKWAVVSEPRVKDDWNHYSLRNMAYQYNAKLRSCSSFPEMIPVYTEIKIRNVKLDTDTMTVMLSRGARFTAITATDLFLLFDEMISLGAKPDIAVVEVLHTILDHAPSETSSTWKESKRLSLISLYDELCAEEIAKLGGEKGFGSLLAAQVARYRRNIASLDGRLSTLTWKQYMAVIPTVEQLFEELSGFLKDYVPKDLQEDFPRTDMRFNSVTSIPHLYRHSALSRPTTRPTASHNNNNNETSSSPLSINYADRMAFRSQFADDLAINEVMLTALERLIDYPLETRLPRSDETALLLLFEKFVKSTGILVTADLAAQMMEVCKFATTFSNEAAASRILQMAFYGSAVPNTPYRNNWRLAEVGVDGRVVGRFLAARNPWGPLRFDLNNNGKLDNFKVLSGDSIDDSPKNKTDENDASGSEGDASGDNNNNNNKRKPIVSFTSAAVRERWESAQKAVADSGALDFDAFVKVGQPIDVDAAMESFTGLACFLRNMFLEERYPPTEEQLRAAGQLDTNPDTFNRRNNKGTVASRSMTIDACESIFYSLSELKRSMDTQISEAKLLKNATTTTIGSHTISNNNNNNNGVELVPDLECFESMLILSKHMMDFLLSRRDQSGQASRQQADDLFKQVAALRHTLLEECRSKYDGRFKILWLQEM